nr:hypothetical protein Iba_chr15fCG5750 [Ipomoea batatas]
MDSWNNPERGGNPERWALTALRDERDLEKQVRASRYERFGWFENVKQDTEGLPYCK